MHLFVWRSILDPCERDAERGIGLSCRYVGLDGTVGKYQLAGEELQFCDQ